MYGMSTHFRHIQNYLKTEGNLKNNSLLRQKNTYKMHINHKETRVFKDGED